MNIFYLNSDPAIAAAEICRVHVNKMIIESTQMLSTAHHVLDLGVYTSKELEAYCMFNEVDPWYTDVLMKPVHANHPDTIWVRQNSNHYKWLAQYTIELISIYMDVSEKSHDVKLKRSSVFRKLPTNIPKGAFVPPPMCMPDHHKHKYSVVKAYRSYLNEKYNEWQTRDRPIKLEFPKGKPFWLELNETKTDGDSQ